MSAWGHKIRALNIAEEPPYNGSCSGRLCRNAVTYLASYDYVTGRKGRVSYAIKGLCPDHAAKFAANHGLQLPAIQVSP